MPNTPTMSMVDAQDGTGVTWTVSGASGGSVQSLLYAALDRTPSDLTAAAQVYGSVIVGNGSLLVALPVGHYMGYTVSTLAGTATSNIWEWVVTNIGTTPVHYQCLNAIQTVLQSLSLSGIASGSIVVHKVPVLKQQAGVYSNLTLPAIVVSPLGQEQMNPAEGTNVRDDVGYPCVVALVAAENQAYSGTTQTWLKWREQIARAFRNQRLSDVSTSITTKVEPGPIISLPEYFADNKLVGSLVVRCISREPRGIGA